MSKKSTRKLTLALTLLALTVPGFRAATAQSTSTPPPAAPQSVTGTDPVPTSPNVVAIILAFLHLA
jgi:hypothetical protein